MVSFDGSTIKNIGTQNFDVHNCNLNFKKICQILLKFPLFLKQNCGLAKLLLMNTEDCD